MVSVQLDGNQVEKINSLFDQLTYKEMRGVIRGSLTASASVLKKQTIRNINSSPFDKSDEMKGSKGVKHKVRLMGVDSSFATVYLWSWNRILEAGTVNRVTKKGYNRGQINGHYFFDKAKKQTEDEVFNTMQSRVLSKIERTWNRRQN